MRKTIKRGLASLLGLATLGAVAVATAAPAQAAVGDCPKGYFCAWTQEDARGTMFKTKTNMPAPGPAGSKFLSHINRTALYACLYGSRDYKAYDGYSIESPSSNGSWTTWSPTTIASIKFSRTERECSQPSYPSWYAQTAPRAAGFGDLNGDRRADVLSRDLVGRLWFLPGDGSGRMVGSGGWNAMDAFVRHGDFSRDGREDLVVRERSTGRLWLYPGTGTGALGARKLIGSGGWNSMNSLAGVGDLTRDGRADLLAVEKSTGKLWLYPGTASGGLGARKLIGSGGWNAMNALVGPGDTNGDGRVDLIARERSTGRLWSYPGTASGGLGARKLIGSGGWNAMDTFLAVGDTTGDGRPDLSTVTNERYAIDGYQGHLGWLVRYRGLGTGAFAAGERTDGEWWGLNGAF
ncbi:FG-GAP-like repeat-containing protein [Streptomyces sp. NPDC012950]|uniref:FG-GAP-like repeat-containing protein n=1 Tax=Streptomyces sp. NPDC012950 TaxID=3364858 RepID=UPI0036A24920